MAETLQGTAVIIASRMDPDHDRHNVEDSRDDSLFGELVTEAVGTLYEFALEVTVSGHETYRVGGIRSRVPSKATRISLFETHPIPITLEVPVRVAANNAETIAIDWKAFIALPDRVQRLEEARTRALAIAAEVQMAAVIAQDPSRAPSADDQNPAMAWAEAVRAGTLSRAEFDQSCMQLLALGQLRSADYLAAEARLTAPYAAGRLSTWLPR